jgi:hypothetical protein
MQTYAQTQQTLEVLQMLARGEMELEAGVGFNLEDVFAEADALLGGGYLPVIGDEIGSGRRERVQVEKGFRMMSTEVCSISESNWPLI